MNTTMSKAELDKLESLAKEQRRVAKTGVDQMAAERLADVEAQLSAQHDARAPAWAEVTARAEAACRHADEEVSETCRRLGIAENLRPSIVAQWYSRGENAEKGRRAELRKLAERRLQAEAKAAKHQIDRATLGVLTGLATRALTSAEATAFLDSMPTVEQLMPRLVIRELEAGQ